MTDSISRVRFTARSIIATLSLTILGLLPLLASVSLQDQKSFLYQLLYHLSAALLIGGIWTGVYEWFMRFDFVRLNQEQAAEILNRIRLADGEESVGLLEVVEDSNEYDYSPLLLEASELTIVPALVPPPRFHMVRYHGVLAPSAAWRELVVPESETADVMKHSDCPAAGKLILMDDAARARGRRGCRSRNYSWARAHDHVLTVPADYVAISSVVLLRPWNCPHQGGS